MSIVPTTLRLATAICWSGWTRAALRSSRLFRMACAWASRSTWPRPIESSQSCHGLTIVGRSWLRPGIEATNSAIEVARAPATRMRMTSRIATTVV